MWFDGHRDSGRNAGSPRLYTECMFSAVVHLQKRDVTVISYYHSGEALQLKKTLTLVVFPV